MSSSVVFSSAQAEGAWNNGTLVEKQNSESEDGHRMDREERS